MLVKANVKPQLTTKEKLNFLDGLFAQKINEKFNRIKFVKVKFRTSF